MRYLDGIFVMTLGGIGMVMPTPSGMGSYHIAVLLDFWVMVLMMMACFILSWSFLGSSLSSQTDPPTFKNDGFMYAGIRFLNNQHFRSKDGFETDLKLKSNSNHPC